MTKAIAIFKLTALLALTALLVITAAAAWELRNAGRAATEFIESDRGLRGTAANLNGVLLQVGFAADNVAQSSAVQKQHWEQTAQQTALAMSDLRTAIRNFDQRVNNELLPQLTTTLRTTDENTAKVLIQTADSLRQITEEAHTTFQKANVVLDDTHALASDPNIPATIEETRTTMGEVRKSAENVTAMSNDGKAMTADAREAFHRATRPGSLVIKAFQAALNLTVKIAQLFAGFAK